MNEKTYRILGMTGIIGITNGIIIMAVGLTTGVLSVIAGARAMQARKDLMI